jgi:hypothetical protein
LGGANHLVSTRKRAGRQSYVVSCGGNGPDLCTGALKLGIPVEAVIPLDDYERFFSGRGIATYHQLLKLSAQTSLHWKGDPEHAFLNAGRYIVDRCGVLFAVWDGEAADGIGGTADIVHYALAQGRKVLHFNPCDKSIHEI